MGDVNKLNAFFTYIHRPISMDAFEDKLEIQKITFLAQTFGIDLGYPFEWYIRGPYCKQVSEHAHKILDNDLRSTDNAGLDEEKIREFGQILQPYINDTEWLEIAGSLVYLRNENYSGIPLDQIIGYLIEDLTFGYKNFDESLVRRVIEEMRRINLFN